jgi:hypothetical protein
VARARQPHAPEASFPRTVIPPASRSGVVKLALVVILLAAPLAAAVPTVSSPCNDWAPGGLVDASCPAPIHPGARMDNGCTLAWILTDGTDLYAMTAAHCTGWGVPLRVDGVDRDVGTLVYRGPDDQWAAGRFGNDSAFFVIDAADRGLVDGSLAVFGGPRGTPMLGSPAPGQPLVQYGWGVATKDVPEARGRPGVTLYAYPTDHQVIWASGGVSGGDSGSPVMTADGEAVGITSAGVFEGSVACLVQCLPVSDPTAHVVFSVSLGTEKASLERALGKTLTLVSGREMVDGKW